MKVKKNQMIVPHFTHVALALGAMGFVYERPDMWAVASCLFVGVVTSFHMAALLDSSAFPRMRLKNNWSFCVFHAGNLVLHVFPLLVVWRYPPLDVQWHHAVCASATLTAWTLAASGEGSLCLDRVYVTMTPEHWRLMFGTAVLTHALCVPFL